MRSINVKNSTGLVWEFWSAYFSLNMICVYRCVCI